jgi:ATP-dependent RNA helicase DeaD
MVAEFRKLGLDESLIRVIEQLGYSRPTPIQQEAIPALLDGRNVIGQAQTGTGKTAAFGLPMLQRIQPGLGPVQALALAPTRELASQVAEALNQMASTGSARVLAVYGGQSYGLQKRALARGVDVVVATPGRLLDLLRQQAVDLSQVNYLVLDEADEMLDMGFLEDVEAILAQLPAERQTALFSATLPDAVRRLADRVLTDPVQITINPQQRTVAETEQRYCRIREEDKLAGLARLLEVETVKSALVFARTKVRAQELAESLANQGYAAEALHGDLSQVRREQVLSRFREGAITLLVATDVAARGLDIEDVSHVFNYDLPNDAEDYVHRIGRTGRAGRKGIAITFVTPRERRYVPLIERFTGQPLHEVAIPSREQIRALRDQRFMQRLTEQLGRGKINGERALIAELEQTSFDLVEIAAAAIQLARASESNLPILEISELPPEPVGRHERPAQNRKDAGLRGRPAVGKSRRESAGGHRQNDGAMVRLKMNLGGQHGLRPSDVVGAIAGEVGIPGRAIGAIDIHDQFTLVDVAEKHAGKVLRESCGAYSLRGKAVTLTLAG